MRVTTGYQIHHRDQTWLSGCPRSYWSVIYICEDRRGAVLYVGQTYDWWTRRNQHVRKTSWWPDVERVHLLTSIGDEWPPDKEQIRRRDERILIRLLDPEHNVMSRRGHLPARGWIHRESQVTAGS